MKFVNTCYSVSGKNSYAITEVVYSYVGTNAHAHLVACLEKTVLGTICLYNESEG